jgi:uncharacterized membrane protein YfcA
MVVLGQALVYFAALAGIMASTVGLLYFTGRALNRARPSQARLRSGALAALSLMGVFACAAGGFFGIGALMYLATR